MKSLLVLALSLLSLNAFAACWTKSQDFTVEHSQVGIKNLNENILLHIEEVAGHKGYYNCENIKELESSTSLFNHDKVIVKVKATCIKDVCDENDDIVAN